MMTSVNEIRAAVRDAAFKYPVKKVFLFGSYADGTATEDSDIDLVVEFTSPNVSLFLIMDMKYTLEERLHKPVDLVHGPLEPGAMIKLEKMVDVYEH
jgi:hypothetical protein